VGGLELVVVGTVVGGRSDVLGTLVIVTGVVPGAVVGEAASSPLVHPADSRANTDIQSSAGLAAGHRVFFNTGSTG
jgi:hypothetical protein